MSGIFSEKVIRNKKMEEQDVREYLQIRKMMEAVDKAQYKPQKERQRIVELAPISCGIIIFMAIASASSLIMMRYILQVMMCDVVAWLAIKLLNPTWLHNHRRRLGAEAAGIDIRELAKRYEKDYLKKDKYISQRLLAALYQNQVSDTAAALIYSVGRMRSAEYVAELEDLNVELEEKVVELEYKLKDAVNTASEAAERERDAEINLQLAKEQVEQHKQLRKKAEQERDRAIREFEIEIVGSTITDQEREREKAARMQERIKNLNKDCLIAAGITEDEIIVSMNEKEYIEEKKTLQSGIITESQRKDIVYKLKNGYRQKDLAKMYGISQSAISKIKKRATA